MNKIFLSENDNFMVMSIDEIILYCSGKPGAEECFPFNETTLVFKVNGKMFLLMGLEHEPVQFNVKCDPERAEGLCEEYECITPGYHMNKKHWITVSPDSSISKKILKELINDSYDLVANSKKKEKKK